MSVEEKEDVVICRACMSECTQYKSLYKEGLIMGEVTTLATLLSFCTNLDFTPEDDALPAHVCARCVMRLAKSYLFKSTVLETNEFLQKQHPGRLDSVEVDDGEVDEKHYMTEEIGARELQELANAAQIKRDMENMEYVTLTVLEEAVDEDECLEVEHEQHIVTFVKDEEEGEDDDVEEEDIVDDEEVDTEETLSVDVDTEETTSVDVGESNYVYNAANDSDEHVREDIYEVISLDVNMQNTEDEGDEADKTNVHNRSETDDQAFEGSSAKRSFKPRSGGKRKKTPIPGLKCKLCGKQLSNSNSLKYHMQLHSDNTPYLCSLCGEGFKTRNAYEGHCILHDPNNPNTCDLCGKAYRQSSSLRTHMLSHTGEKPYQCDICGKGMTQKSGYKKHMLIHSGEKPHTCDICKREFRYSSNLIAHRRCHSEDKPFSCPHCDKCFHTMEQRKRHLLVHSGEKPFPCEVCGKKFKRRSSLSTHRHVHESVSEITRGLVDQKVSKSNVVQLY